LDHYTNTFESNHETRYNPDINKPSITRVSVLGAELNNGNLVVDVGFESPFPLTPPIPGVLISSLSGVPVYGTNPRFHGTGYQPAGLKQGVIRMRADKLPIKPGHYRISVWLGDWHTDYDQRYDAVSFEFKMDRQTVNIPSPESIGFIDQEAKWQPLDISTE
jgi:lipopolysaccharide transport system ATP-binding protein